MRVFVVGLASLTLGCTLLNPAFDEQQATTKADGDLSETSTGDGDPSTSDGDDDPSTGTGDGDPSTGTGDGDGDPSTGDGDGDPGCEPPLPDLCGDTCTNQATDPNHCGGCDEICEADLDCVGGSCLRPRIVFVTSELFSGGELQSVWLADAVCNTLGQPYFENQVFWAWNSAANDSPASQFATDGYFVRPDGVVIAESWEALTSGSLHAPIDRNQKNEVIPEGQPCALADQVWTGTAANGEFKAPNCLSWSSSSAEETGVIGFLHATDSTWTDAPPQNCGNPPTCNGERRIYCFEI